MQLECIGKQGPSPVVVALLSDFSEADRLRGVCASLIESGVRPHREGVFLPDFAEGYWFLGSLGARRGTGSVPGFTGCFGIQPQEADGGCGSDRPNIES